MKTALLIAFALMCGCANSTELLLVVSSNLFLPTEADTLRLKVSQAVTHATIFDGKYPLDSPMALPASLDLSGSRSSPTVALLAQLERNGVAVVERRAIVPFQPEHALKLRIALDRSCIGSKCTGNTTCSDGVCIPVEVPPTDLEPIGKDPFVPTDMRVTTSYDFSSGLDQGMSLADLGQHPSDFSESDLSSPVCGPTGMCPSGPACGPLCCAAGESCDNGTCHCGGGGGGACAGTSICASAGPVRSGANGCGTICCGGGAGPCPL